MTEAVLPDRRERLARHRQAPDAPPHDATGPDPLVTWPHGDSAAGNSPAVILPNRSYFRIQMYSIQASCEDL